MQRPSCLSSTIDGLNYLTDAVQTQFTDRPTDVPVAQQRQIPTVQTAQNTAQTLQSPFLDKVDDMPVIVPAQVSMIQTVQSPVPAAVKGDLAEAESKNSCAHVTADHEVSAKTSAEELKTWADATQVIGSKAYSLFPVSSFTGVHTTVDLKEFDVVKMMRRLAQKEHSAALPQLPASIKLVRRKWILKLRWRRTLTSSKQMFRTPAKLQS